MLGSNFPEINVEAGGGSRLGAGFIAGIVATAVVGGALGWGRGGYGGYGGCYGHDCGHGGHYGHYYDKPHGDYIGSKMIVNELEKITQGTNDRSQWEAIAKLSEKVAVADTHAKDNYAFDRERAHYVDKLTKAEIKEATCDFLPARKMIRPEDMGSPYHGGQNLLVSTHIPPYAPYPPFNPIGNPYPPFPPFPPFPPCKPVCNEGPTGFF